MSPADGHDISEEAGASHSSVIDARRAKLRELEARGVQTYAYAYDPTHGTAAARAQFEVEESAGAEESADAVRLAGRLVSFRSHGKSTFADLADRAGRVQLYFKANELGDAYAILELLDIGDWVGAEGHLFRTRMGEVTLRVTRFTILAKSVRPLPFGKEEIDAETGERRVYSGFADVEQRYRQRYADLAVNPDVRDVFVTRARVITLLRRYLDQHDYIEVETPVLQPMYGGAFARPFATHHNALDMRLFLRISDELYLKRLIVGGLERVYEIGKDFRNEGMDRTHNPEFTMLEFYEAFADYERMMRRVEEMFSLAVQQIAGERLSLTFDGRDIDFTPPFRRLPYFTGLQEYGGIDARAMSDDELRAELRKLNVPDVAAMSRGKLLDELFGQLVEARLEQPTFVTDFPRELSPLAKPKRDDPELVERFELIVAGRELANAFSELNDPEDQRERLEAQSRLRDAGDEEAQALDEDYIRAIEYGMPPTGGVGIGIDRLVMLLTDRPSIRDVVLFPTMRPE